MPLELDFLFRLFAVSFFCLLYSCQQITSFYSHIALQLYSREETRKETDNRTYTNIFFHREQFQIRVIQEQNSR